MGDVSIPSRIPLVTRLLPSYNFPVTMKKQGMLGHLVKLAFTDLPLWVHVPGMPITLPGKATQTARLPGMVEWAPQPMVERVGRGLRKGFDAETLAEQEAQRGLPGRIAMGAGLGVGAGAIGGRFLGGEAAATPFKQLLEKGIGRQTLKGLSKLPTSMKLAPLFGLGAGAGIAAARWAQGRGDRQRQAKEVARGLLLENQLQYNDLLRGIPAESASATAPIAVTPGNTGV